MIICPTRALFHPLNQDYSEHANHDTLSRRAIHSRRINNTKRRYLLNSRNNPTAFNQALWSLQLHLFYGENHRFF